jgi:hypothetical protein
MISGELLKYRKDLLMATSRTAVSGWTPCILIARARHWKSSAQLKIEFEELIVGETPRVATTRWVQALKA